MATSGQRPVKFRGHDWRRHPRYLIHHPVHLSPLGAGKNQPGMCVNISEGGAMFVSESAHAFGDLLDLEFRYSGEDHSESVSLNAVVVWVMADAFREKSRDAFRVGVEFVNLNNELPHQLYEMIQHFRPEAKDLL